MLGYIFQQQIQLAQCGDSVSRIAVVFQRKDEELLSYPQVRMETG